ncbi:MAG: LPXTG cell wall anchor domain-containing protein [Nocardioidaceae bacterium]
MQIRHKVVRVAAAATVTVFLAAGAMSPSFAVTTSTEDSTASEETTTEQQSTDDATKSKGKKDANTAPDHSEGTASTEGEYDEPQPESTADENDGGANAGDCEDGPEHNYCSTRDGSESENGMGDGEAKGKPCAGCVGKADNKNPKGQYPHGGDHNAGYECDRNQGIGQSNPAHTGCTGETESGEVEVTCPEGAEMNDEGECVVPTEETCPEGAEMVDGECVVPTTDEGCPQGAEMNDEGECVVPTEETCPEGATMNDEGECVVPAIVTPVTTDEVAGVEAETPPADAELESPAANRAPATVAPASGILPATGAGQYGLILAAGAALLAAGGFLIARKRSQAGS